MSLAGRSVKLSNLSFDLKGVHETFHVFFSKYLKGFGLVRFSKDSEKIGKSNVIV